MHFGKIGRTYPMATKEKPRFIGWHRRSPKFPWRPVVDGQSEYEVLRRLLEMDWWGDLTVLPTGRDPNQESMLR